MLTAGLAACGGSTDKPQVQTSVTFEREPAGPTTPVTPSPVPPALPTAKDGQNYKACNDGNCEVLIRKTAVITLNGEKNTATVKDGSVRLTHGSGYVSLGGLGGAVTWYHDDGPTHSASLKYAEGDTVIMVIRTQR
jgi:hypothetical protein